ncbi:myb/SANT-like DNA-binding domain-containing protein 4 [Cynoglossus semilaevis]|uniref:myb/SANT-like DNA-binding domain-containing protein 4 n=1 Tax=Cynoglossus semilaevis TaxID=244447 RepID=UPI000D630818|nr:myb/SANT-like DNA-binding domain-containing protein 4 [Cynoglossus semilaevis]
MSAPPSPFMSSLFLCFSHSRLLFVSLYFWGFCSHLSAKLDFLQVKHLKRKRKSNYSVRETQTLIREIHKRRDVLFSRQQNTAINELKRQAWEEVARGVNSLGEGELRTAAEVKRRYLDCRALMKRKQLQAELSLSSSSSSSLVLKTEYDDSSPVHEAVPLGSGWDQLQDLSGFPKDSQCDWPELMPLSEPNGHALITPADMKMENDVTEYRLDGDVGDGEEEIDEDDIPSLLSDIESHSEGHVGDVYLHNGVDTLGSSAKAPTSTTNRDLPTAHVETERLDVEKERLAVEKERLQHVEVERERLQLEKERLLVERERLRLLFLSHSELVDSSSNLPSQQGPPSSSTPSSSCTQRERESDGERWTRAVDLETERMKLEKERLQLEKERLQFFRFEASRLQIERERLQVEKERMQLLRDHQSH